MKYLIIIFSALYITAAIADNEIISNEALDSYTNEYLKGRSNKAFAQSPDGPWGWVDDRTSVEIAKRHAVRICRKYLEKGEADCVVININGKWVKPQ